ncbi:hypothetical protein [Nocardioides sp. T2.26MG-1]|uniref:hypothetical protein n=1 Tax=Nocardioides sp. T2.26MG-1 TaxID=3041166 RepID=UPI002477C19F|nr:hypothetical protein [Nocardioides sp. T2.26MG-1]CAI9416560.1 hypothetical protein HIDPHFAB_02803 [Nocardioides sp. T2.26MG-1]
MSGAIETDVPGDPAAFQALADYLRSCLAARAEALADRTADQRSALAGSWLGTAADAFGDRAATLVTASDGYARLARAAAEEVEALGETLRLAQRGMAEVRAAAGAGGLQVEGTVIVWPAEAWELDLLATTRLREAWNTALAGAEAHRRTWYAALDSAAGFAREQSGTLVSLTTSLVTTAAGKALLVTASRIMAGEADFRASEVARLERQMAELAESVRRFDRPGDRELYGRLMDEKIENRHAAAAARVAAERPELPREVRGGLGALSVLAAGYGVYADVQAGESTEQAVVSQGSGLLGGVAGAAGLGAAVGSVAPGPGTVTGAVVVGGAAFVGGAAGSLVGDKFVDSLFGHGDSEDDDGEANRKPDPGVELLDYAAQALSSPRAAHRDAP